MCKARKICKIETTNCCPIWSIICSQKYLQLQNILFGEIPAPSHGALLRKTNLSNHLHMVLILEGAWEMEQQIIKKSSKSSN